MTPDYSDLLAQIPARDITAKLGVSDADARAAIDAAVPSLVGGLKANADGPAGSRCRGWPGSSWAGRGRRARPRAGSAICSAICSAGCSAAASVSEPGGHPSSRHKRRFGRELKRRS